MSESIGVESLVGMLTAWRAMQDRKADSVRRCLQALNGSGAERGLGGRLPTVAD